MLRQWKKRSGISFDRRVIRFDDHRIQKLMALTPAAIVPVPQGFERSWHLRGSPAGKVAQALSRKIRIPVLHPLLSDHSATAAIPRQAQLPLSSRLQNPLRFRSETEIHGPILLVDDFMTTGKTLRSAAQALKAAGASGVHVFCLGVRPTRLLEEKPGKHFNWPEMKSGFQPLRA